MNSPIPLNKSLLLILLTSILLFAIDDMKPPLFTPQELSYLHNKKEIKMCVDPNWLPLEKIENGKYIGLGSEYIQRLENAIDYNVSLCQDH